MFAAGPRAGRGHLEEAQGLLVFKVSNLGYLGLRIFKIWGFGAGADRRAEGFLS